MAWIVTSDSSTLSSFGFCSEKASPLVGLPELLQRLLDCHAAPFGSIDACYRFAAGSATPACLHGAFRPRARRPSPRRRVATSAAWSSLSYFWRGQKNPRRPSLRRRGDHVHVQVRDALAHAVVDRDERALGAEPLLHRTGEQPRVREELGQHLVGQVGERLDVGARDQQGVAGEQRAVIEERERLRRPRARPAPRRLTADDRAEGAVAPSTSVGRGRSDSGRTIGGAFGSSPSSISTSPKPERRIKSGVGRLRVAAMAEPAPERREAVLPLGERRDRRSARARGRAACRRACSTRSISASARSGSRTVHSTSVQTAVSNESSANGRLLGRRTDDGRRGRACRGHAFASSRFAIGSSGSVSTSSLTASG